MSDQPRDLKGLVRLWLASSISSPKSLARLLLSTPLPASSPEVATRTHRSSSLWPSRGTASPRLGWSPRDPDPDGVVRPAVLTSDTAPIAAFAPYPSFIFTFTIVDHGDDASCHAACCECGENTLGESIQPTFWFSRGVGPTAQHHPDPPAVPRKHLPMRVSQERGRAASAVGGASSFDRAAPASTPCRSSLCFLNCMVF